MGAILIQQMMEIDKQDPQILDFLRMLTGIDGQDAKKFEEIEEDGFSESFEDERAVGVFGRGGGSASRGRGSGRGSVELGDSHLLEG